MIYQGNRFTLKPDIPERGREGLSRACATGGHVDAFMSWDSTDDPNSEIGAKLAGIHQRRYDTMPDIAELADPDEYTGNAAPAEHGHRAPGRTAGATHDQGRRTRRFAHRDSKSNKDAAIEDAPRVRRRRRRLARRE